MSRGGLRSDENPLLWSASKGFPRRCDWYRFTDIAKGASQRHSRPVFLRNVACCRSQQGLIFFPSSFTCCFCFHILLLNSAAIGPGNHLTSLRTRIQKIFGLFLPECRNLLPGSRRPKLYLSKTWLRRSHLAFDGLVRPCFMGSPSK
jgi:hypothetical protein